MKFLLAPIILISITLLIITSFFSCTFKYIENKIAEFIDYTLRHL